MLVVLDIKPSFTLRVKGGLSQRRDGGLRCVSRSMSQMTYLVSSGFRRQSCKDSASRPWAKQKRMKARPFPRGVFSCKVPRGQGGGGVRTEATQPAEGERRWEQVVNEKGCRGT